MPLLRLNALQGGNSAIKSDRIEHSEKEREDLLKRQQREREEFELRQKHERERFELQEADEYEDPNEVALCRGCRFAMQMHEHCSWGGPRVTIHCTHPALGDDAQRVHGVSWCNAYEEGEFSPARSDEDAGDDLEKGLPFGDELEKAISALEAESEDPGEAGEDAREGDDDKGEGLELEKALSHKYLRKFKQGDQWRYVYPGGKGDRHSDNHTVALHQIEGKDEHYHEGASFSAGSNKGHYVIEKAKDGHVTFHHDDVDGKGTKGKSETLSLQDFKHHVAQGHRDAIGRHFQAGMDKRGEAYVAAVTNGTTKQALRAHTEMWNWHHKHEKVLNAKAEAPKEASEESIKAEPKEAPKEEPKISDFQAFQEMMGSPEMKEWLNKKLPDESAKPASDPREEQARIAKDRDAATAAMHKKHAEQMENSPYVDRYSPKSREALKRAHAEQNPEVPADKEALLAEARAVVAKHGGHNVVLPKDKLDKKKLNKQKPSASPPSDGSKAKPPEPQKPAHEPAHEMTKEEYVHHRRDHFIKMHQEENANKQIAVDRGKNDPNDMLAHFAKETIEENNKRIKEIQEGKHDARFEREHAEKQNSQPKTATMKKSELTKPVNLSP